MALSILSHSVIWDGFRTGTVKSEIISETVSRGVYDKKLYVCCGGELAGVKAFVEITGRTSPEKLPAVMVIGDLKEKQDVAFTEKLVSIGYAVAYVDVAGENPEKEYYTVYPEEKAYANYKDGSVNLYGGFENEKKVCWFTWVKVCKSVIKYLSGLPYINGIGGFASGEAATALWQLAAVEPALSCAVFVGNAGWQSYRGTDKFSDDEPAFSDEALAVIADIEAQSYAKRVKCPSLLLSAIGDKNCDFDRAYDTMARISEKTYKATLYSFKRESVSETAFTDVKLFFEKFLKKDPAVEIADEAGFQLLRENGKVIAEATLNTKNPESVRFYYSEGQVSPEKRFYETLVGEEVKSGVKYRARIPVGKGAGIVAAFVSVKYANGFCVSSDVESLKIPEGEGEEPSKSGVVYSSREVSRSVFFPLKEEYGSSRIDFKGDNAVKKKSGPMGVDGVYCKNGIATFKINGEKLRPDHDSILMFDAYAKTDVKLRISLFADFTEERIEYSETVSVKGGQVWRNFRLDNRRFKTEGGMPLKNYGRIDAVAFLSDGECLINNVLWV